MATIENITANVGEPAARGVSPWVRRATIGWEQRRILLRASIIGLVASTAIAFLIPKQYESTARMMPPEGGMPSAVLAALAGRALPGNLGALAGSLLGRQSSSTMFVNLLQSRSVTEAIVNRFELQRVYWSRYKQDAIKRLKRRTDISEDHKTGIITITVADTDRQRARDMTLAYLDELNTLVTRVNTSAAGRQREFIQNRLVTVKQDLEDAEQKLSAFSTKNATLDVKEQTRAMVDATAKLEGQLIVSRSELSSLGQIYGPENVRVRAARARVGQLESAIKTATGFADGGAGSETAPYPTLRAIPTLSVQWADLYRRVRIQETVFDLLTQEYELARIEEAKSIPTVSVIDPPNWPERKSFPPRLVILIVGTLGAALGTFFVLVKRQEWQHSDKSDPQTELIHTVLRDLSSSASHWLPGRFAHRNGHEL